MKKSTSPSRKDKAYPSIEILTVIAIAMEQKYPMDWVVMYTVRAWSHLTDTGIRRDHVVSVLGITDWKFEDSLRRLRYSGYLAIDKDTGYLAITPSGTKKMYSFQAKRSNIWKRMQDYSKAQLVKNFTKNKK